MTAVTGDGVPDTLCGAEPEHIESGPLGGPEEELMRRVLSTLLREDAYGLRGAAGTLRGTDGDRLRLPLPDGPVLIPVEADGFQCEIAARTGALERPDGTRVTGIDAIMGLLRTAVPPEDRPGFDAFVGECHQALATARMQAAERAAVVGRLGPHAGGGAYGGNSGPADGASGGGRGAAPDAHAVPPGTTGAYDGDRAWCGPGGALDYDTLAAHRDHPVYPTGRARIGLDAGQVRAYAPEFAPGFALRWLALPYEHVNGDPAALPHWWPTPADLGLPRLDGSHLALPVHPLTADGPLAEALRVRGLEGAARLADRAWLRVRPTLSMRTVAVTDDPYTHLKLPLATATLGRLNRRGMKPGTLVDGAVGQRLLETVVARHPRFAETVLLADETTHLDAGHDLLATLVRRFPRGSGGTAAVCGSGGPAAARSLRGLRGSSGLRGARVVPVAALAARMPDGSLVADDLARRFYGGDLLAFLDAYLTLLLDWHTTLFAYGIALESHQQNTSLILDEVAGRPRLRLLLKDNDGPRVNTVRLAAVLGGDAADLCGFADRRILVGSDVPVADVFTTITVHLCAGALAFELARLGRAPLPVLLGQLRARLTEAVDRLDAAPGAAAAVLRTRVLDADRLPVKAMVTAGSLLTKRRSGASDINKHYVTGPNYLTPPGR
ncbi:IucA / IucC family protein [Streptomyces rimosus subsp. rimosus]|nr:IucA / IucC family protein [Streptomyces rimosus subsp. rimosus]UTH98368.1 IucA / IucC family protein [Streptomyces rimosus subsp. rimosus]UTJ16467.1 IucA / IucC family protein [Streptomyces rimosus subsp. rimosus]